MRSLGANRLRWVAQHSMLRPRYLPPAVGTCMEVWGAQLGHSHRYQQETVHLFVLGEKEAELKGSAPSALANPSMSAMCCLPFSLD